MTTLTVTGLRREARLLAGPGIEVVVGGGDHRHLEAMIEERVADVTGIISMGIAGGLAPSLRAGQWVVANAVLDHGDALPTDAAWMQRLKAQLPGAIEGVFLGTDAMIAETAEKAALHRATKAIAVDMESHVAARVAARHRLPFAAARVICDPAHRTLPPAARVGMRADGRVDVAAVLRSLVSAPGQVPDLIRTAFDAERALKLLRGHRILAGLAGPDLA
ncbi:phosphorylase [Reyranella sp.]|uniref:phosphorylase family protein n=1 Tax=Reyranella sp. TaxID=1929291 RepID=UPI002F93998E